MENKQRFVFCKNKYFFMHFDKKHLLVMMKMTLQFVINIKCELSDD